MRIEQEALNKLQSVATILSAVAIPIVIAVVGWQVQSSMSSESIKKDYVQMAIGILRDESKRNDEQMRRWAVDVLNKNSPVPFSRDLQDKLAQGAMIVAPSFPSPPASLMQPPVKLEPLPGEGNATVGDLLRSTVENYGRCHQNANTLEFLQKWVLDMKTIHDRFYPQKTADGPNESISDGS